jgi:hypothetical protein
MLTDSDEKLAIAKFFENPTNVVGDDDETETAGVRSFSDFDSNSR